MSNYKLIPTTDNVCECCFGSGVLNGTQELGDWVSLFCYACNGTGYTHLPEPHHFNSPSFYPPVGVWLVIATPNGEVRVKRPSSYVSHHEDMIYWSEEGNEIRGRYRWRYD